MKKAAVVTLYGNYNYGNKLQNYAVQEVLKSHGYQAETLVFTLSRVKECGRSVKRILQMISGKPEMRRYCVFSRFNQEMLSVRYIYAPDSKVSSKLKKEYAYFCVGSDQVWNPEIRTQERNIFFLSFAEPEQRICISPSIGVKKIDGRYEEVFRNGLNGFRNLCCREKDGAEEISRISGKNCQHLIDPTMVLPEEKWRAFASERPLKINKKYMLCFFLGDFNPALREKAQKYASEHDLDMITPSDTCSRYYSCDPREMVSLIDHAEMVLTDSFHFSVFSIILNRPFWVFDRFSSSELSNHINSRIISLVDQFELQSRYTDAESVQFGDDCDFSGANAKLTAEKEKFDRYLCDCLP